MGQNNDFVNQENVTTDIVNDFIFLDALYPNGIHRKIKIKKEDLINALRLCQKSKNLV